MESLPYEIFLEQLNRSLENIESGYYKYYKLDFNYIGEDYHYAKNLLTCVFMSPEMMKNFKPILSKERFIEDFIETWVKVTTGQRQKGENLWIKTNKW